MADISCPLFNGNDWQEWSETFQAFSLLKGWSDAQKLTALPFYLDSASRQVFRSLTNEQRVDWATVCQSLAPIFAQEIDDTEQKFFARRQDKNETLAMYAAVLRLMGKNAFALHNDVTRGQLILKQFLVGIDPVVAEETARMRPQDLNEALTFAQYAFQMRRTMDEVKQKNAQLTTASGGPSTASISGGHEEMDALKQMVEQLTITIGDLSTKVHRLGSKQSEEPTRSSVRWRSPSPARGNAHQPGQGNRTATPPRIRPTTSREEPSTRRSSVRCYECNARGHVRRECPNRRNQPEYRRQWSGNAPWRP